MTKREQFLEEFMSGFPLTFAERDEVQRIIAGLGGKASAAVIGLSPDTVRSRRKAIYRKIGVTTAQELMSMLLRRVLSEDQP